MRTRAKPVPVDTTADKHDYVAVGLVRRRADGKKYATYKCLNCSVIGHARILGTEEGPVIRDLTRFSAKPYAVCATAVVYVRRLASMNASID